MAGRDGALDQQALNTLPADCQPCRTTPREAATCNAAAAITAAAAAANPMSHPMQRYWKEFYTSKHGTHLCRQTSRAVAALLLSSTMNTFGTVPALIKPSNHAGYSIACLHQQCSTTKHSLWPTARTNPVSSTSSSCHCQGGPGATCSVPPVFTQTVSLGSSHRAQATMGCPRTLPAFAG
jgi:hypothetical protein